jgi:hypothetical protein
MFPVSGGVTSSINIFSCIGEFAIPLVVSAYIEHNPMMYLWIVFCYGSLAVVMFVLCTVVERKVKAQRSVCIP